MIEEILPAGVAVVATRGDIDGALFPKEEALIERAVAKRRREFTTARACARGALAQLGLPEAAIASGEKGEPLWPEGIVGSLTHCEGYRAAAVGRSMEFLTIGIDAEPNAPLPDGLEEDIARPEEIARLRELAREGSGAHWDRLLFSAKESVYKAWFPLARDWLGYEEATLTVDSGAKTFHARLLVPGPVVDGAELRGFSGRWIVRDGIVATAIAVPAGDRAA